LSDLPNCAGAPGPSPLGTGEGDEPGAPGPSHLGTWDSMNLMRGGPGPSPLGTGEGDEPGAPAPSHLGTWDSMNLMRRVPPVPRLWGPGKGMSRVPRSLALGDLGFHEPHARSAARWTASPPPQVLADSFPTSCKMILRSLPSNLRPGASSSRRFAAGGDRRGQNVT